MDFSVIWGFLLAIFILLGMITIHEFGHYITGKLLGFNIKEFSIGFGPALFKRKSKKSGEQFSLRLIPLGGYCAFAGEDGEDITDKKENEATMSEVSAVFPDMKETGEDKDTPVNVAEKIAESGNFTDMPPWKRIVVLVSGALMNYLLALICIFCSFGFCGEALYGVVEAERTDEIAAEYCLRDGDVFFEAENKSIYTVTDLMSALKGKKEGDTVTLLVSRITEGTLQGEHKREKMEVQVRLRCATNFENSTDTDRLWQALGVAKKSNGDGTVTYQVGGFLYRWGFFETIGRGTVYSIRLAGSIFGVLGELLTGSLGVDSMGGPVTTITMTSQIAGMGVREFLGIASYIGVNLAVFNLLPIPALDGSKVVFTAIEWVRGKPINRKVEAVIHTVGMLLLLAFAIFVDILQLI